MKKKKSTKRNIIEWVIIIGVTGFLYFSGLYTDVIGKVQQLVLMTGIKQPEMNIPVDRQQNADFNFELVSIDNRLTNLYTMKGKVIFLNLWASWCPPCRAEMPTIQDLYEKLKGNKDIVFVMISLDDKAVKARKFISEKGYTFPVYFPAGNMPRIYDSGTIPSTFIISPQGKIVSKEIGMADYNTTKVFNFIRDMVKEKYGSAK